jgi:hypothetical protein
MSRILRRPMFRGGRVESKGDLKVVDQMGIAKLANGGMAQRPGYKYGQIVMDEYENINEKIPMPERQPMSTGDYLRIASAGADILGAPSEGSGIFGALRSASPALSKLGVDLGTSIDAREAKALAERNNKVNAVTEGALQMRIAEAGSRKVQDVQAEYLNAFWDPIILAEQDPAKKQKLQNDKEKAVYKVIVLGLDVSDEYKILGNQAAYADAVGMAEGQLQAEGVKRDDKSYQGLRAKYVAKYLAQIAKSLDPTLPGDAGYFPIEEKAKGGRVGKANGGMMTETADVNMMTETPQGIEDVNVSETETMPEQTNEINVSYEQLRDRLPPEVGDDIVLLLSQSYEALADFAEIQTQADVNQFNTKYDVQLFLPQQSGV